MEDSMDARLRELVRMLERKMGLLNEGEMACCQISLAQCHTLVEIGRVAERISMDDSGGDAFSAGEGKSPGISLHSLAGLLGLDSSTMSRTVQHLVVAGLVRREPDPADRRAVMIALTPQGKDQYLQLEAGMRRQYQAVLESIPPDRRVQVLESLLLLNEAMEGCCGVVRDAAAVLAEV